MILHIAWRRQGAVRWESWWTEENGPTRSRIPNLDDHISFVNHDLQSVGFPPVTRNTLGDLQIELRGDENATAGELAEMQNILNGHGFEFID
jgi:hypothetical protein